MDEYERRRRRGGPKGKLILFGIIVVIIVIAILAYYFVGAPINVGSPTTLTLNGQGTDFILGGKSYVATLAAYNSNTQTAYIYLTSVPVFLGPLLNVTLHQNSTVKVNFGGQYAIMQLILLSGGSDSAKVQVTPLSLALQVSPDYQYIGHPTIQMPGLQVTTTIPASTSNGTSTTTIAAGSATTLPTTTVHQSTSTTTVSTNYTLTAIEAAAHLDQNFALMANFSALYNQSRSCTLNAYTSLYFGRYGTAPVPPQDFPNASYETPYAMTQKIVSNGGNSYSLEFLSQVNDQSFNNQPALVIAMTVSGTPPMAVIKSDSYNGIFMGTDYASLLGQYTSFKAENNPCAVMVG